MNSKTVLVVDDDSDSRMICSTILVHNGFQVVEAGDGPAALRLARERCPDVILIDLALPNLDGWAVLDRLKADPVTRSIPVIVLTASAAQADRVRGREAGVSGYLVKPCSPTLVLREVSRAVAPLSDAVPGSSAST